MNNKYYPAAFIVLIAIAVYIMYGDGFIPKVDFREYRDFCHKYQAAEEGQYSTDELEMLVNQIYYLLPDNAADLNDPLEKEVKKCATQLAQQLEKHKRIEPDK